MKLSRGAVIPPVLCAGDPDRTLHRADAGLLDHAVQLHRHFQPGRDGLVLLTGVGGMTSFGQAAFVGFGAYTTAVLTVHFGSRHG